MEETLFGEFDRTNHEPATHAEGSFSFINRSARPAAAKVRSALEKWFSHYPHNHRIDFIKRLRTDFDIHFFELLLFELLTQLQYDVEVHPTLRSQHTRRPDFRAVHDDGHSVYVEAVTVTEMSREKVGKSRMIARLFDQVNELALSDYFLRIKEIRNPRNKQPPGKKFNQFIEKCIKILDYDRVLESAEKSYQSLPSWTFKDGDIEIDFGVLPVSRESRGRTDRRPIGLYPIVTEWSKSNINLRKAISNKATRYGHPNDHFLIAVNSGLFVKEQDEIQALYGDEAFTIRRPGDSLIFHRKSNGVWVGPRGIQNKRLSGVLFFNAVPWNLPKARVCVYPNPWAEYEYKGPLFAFPTLIAGEDGRLSSAPGTTIGKILSLEESWPGKLFD